MSIFGIFHDARSPNMAMSRGSRSKFRKKLLFLILHLIFGKVTKFLVEKLFTSEVISQKPHGRWKNTFGVKLLLFHSVPVEFKRCFDELVVSLNRIFDENFMDVLNYDIIDLVSVRVTSCGSIMG